MNTRKIKFWLGLFLFSLPILAFVVFTYIFHQEFFLILLVAITTTASIFGGLKLMLENA